MKIRCPGCNKVYNIPDEKIPAGKKIELPCPACKTKIPIKAKNSGVSEISSPEKELEICCPTCKSKIRIKVPQSNASETSPPDNRVKKREALIKKIVRESKALPPMPEIMAKVTEVISRDDAGFKDIGAVIKTDQALATRVLKLANSAYYSLSVPVSTVEQASALLGFQALLELVTVVSTSKMMGKSLKGYGIDSKAMWRHSLAVATSSKIIATLKCPTLINDSFNAGLIHDSGMIIMDPYISKIRGTFETLIAKGELAYHEIEKRLFGFDHGLVASEFFKTWKLPQAQTTAIRFHHTPSESNGDPLSYIIHAADSIVMKFESENFKASRFYKTDEGVWDFLDLNGDEIEQISQETQETVNNIIEGIGT